MGVTLKFQSSGQMPGKAGPVQMQGGSLTVGRGPANDLVLPDPDRQLSKSHCVIEDHNGNVVIVDLSTNGTFLNYSKIPLGRTPTPLNNGDVLVMGGYELVVEIRDDGPSFEEMIAPPSEEGGISPGLAERAPDPLALLDDAPPGGDFLDELLGPESAPKGPAQLNPADPIDELLPPMGEEEDPFFKETSDGREGEGASLAAHSASANDSFRPQGTGAGQNLIPDDWDDLLDGIDTPAGVSAPDPLDPFAEPAPPPAADLPAEPVAAPPAPVSPPPAAEVPRQRTPPRTEPEPAEQHAEPPAEDRAEPEPEPKAPVAASEAGADFARAFLDGAGAEDLKIDPADLPSTMARMGRVMKTLVTGLREILMTRTSIKSEFRIEQTMISAGGNNPLKFSISPEQAIETMIKPATRGYLSPEDAAEQALNDIKAHEVAMVTGMEAALRGVLKKLDPKALEGRLETGGGLSGLLKGKKARYWEVYEKLYEEISDQAENDFHDLFSREFARAYKEQLDKLKSG